MTSIQEIKYIGPYLSHRFGTHSYWPPNSNILLPIYTLEDLVAFLRSRRATFNTKDKLTHWMTTIFTNERALQCASNNVRIINGRLTAYQVRQENFCGWNAMIDFMRVNADNLQGHLPSKKRRYHLQRQFPTDCQI